MASTPEIPVYEIEVSASDIAFEVRVNDIPVLRLPASRVRTIFDVNTCIVEGDNTVSLLLRPKGRDFSAAAECSVNVRRRARPGAEEAEDLGTITFSTEAMPAVTGFEPSSPVEGCGPVQVARWGVRGTMRFVAEGAFGPWSFASAQVLTPTEALRAEVVDAYRSIHALLAARSAAKLTAWCALQLADLQRAYGLPGPEQARRMLGVAQLLADPSISVDPFPGSLLTLEVLADGRLVHLLDADGKSPITLRSKDMPAMLGRFTCALCKTAEGWQIAR